MRAPDRTGQVWKLIGATLIVIGPPVVSVDYPRSEHPVLWLDDPEARFRPGTQDELYELSNGDWENQPQLMRIS